MKIHNDMMKYAEDVVVWMPTDIHTLVNADKTKSIEFNIFSDGHVEIYVVDKTDEFGGTESIMFNKNQGRFTPEEARKVWAKAVKDGYVKGHSDQVYTT